MARDKNIEEHFAEASVWGVFVQRFRPEEFSSTGGLIRPGPESPISRSGRQLRIFQRRCCTIGRWSGRRRGTERGRQNLNEIIHSNLITLAGPLLATAQNYLLHSSLPLCSLLLTNCEGSHSVRLFNYSLIVSFVVPWAADIAGRPGRNYAKPAAGRENRG